MMVLQKVLFITFQGTEMRIPDLSLATEKAGATIFVQMTIVACLWPVFAGCHTCLDNISNVMYANEVLLFLPVSVQLYLRQLLQLE